MPIEANGFDSSVPDSQHGASGGLMSKKAESNDEMADEYDFSKGIRGKYVERLKKGSNVVVLDPDVAAEFDSPQAVNRALRVYLASKKDKKGAA